MSSRDVHARQGPPWFRRTMAGLIARSREVVVCDGYHAPMLMIQRTRHAPPEVRLAPPFRDAERALLEQLAASGVAALYLAREAWWGTGDEALAWRRTHGSLETYPARRECVVIAGVCRTGLALSLWELIRADGRVVRTVSCQPDADLVQSFAFDDLPWDVGLS